jgi:hypothetical protein
MIRRAITMTIGTEIESLAPARQRGWTFASADRVYVISIVGRRVEWQTSLDDVTTACAERLRTVVAGWSSILPKHELVLFAATSSEMSPNVVARRRGLWGSPGLDWLANVRHSENLEMSVDSGIRFAGLAEVPDELLTRALNYARTSNNAVLFYSDSITPSKSDVRSTFERAFPSPDASIDWNALIASVVSTRDAVIKVFGGFDDREVAIDVFVDMPVARLLARNETRER